MKKSATTSEYKPTGEVFSFYGGKINIEKKPWGTGFRFIKLETGKGGILSVTACTKKLDKSDVLVKWATGLVGNHLKSKIEDSSSSSFGKEELFLMIDEALSKPEEGKVKGGEAGQIIHDYAHDFAKAVISGSELPTFNHLDSGNDVEGKALNGINAFLDWYNSSDKIKFLQMEQVVYYNSNLAGDTEDGEDVIEYVGILDLLAEINGQIRVIDYKSSKGIYNDQRYQVSGYFKAYNSNAAKGKKAVGTSILNFGKETGNLIQGHFPAPEVEKDFRAFVGLQMVATRERELDAERK